MMTAEMSTKDTGYDSKTNRCKSIHGLSFDFFRLVDIYNHSYPKISLLSLESLTINFNCRVNRELNYVILLILEETDGVERAMKET